ncbi:MAG: hypothetical protein ACM3QX_14950 [Syntrophomonadaceae bacterium]
MLNNICQPGNRKLAAFFTSIGIYFLLMSLVILTHKLENLSLESFAVSLAAGIMAISYGYYASNAYIAGKTGKASVFTRQPDSGVNCVSSSLSVAQGSPAPASEAGGQNSGKE